MQLIAQPKIEGNETKQINDFEFQKKISSNNSGLKSGKLSSINGVGLRKNSSNNELCKLKDSF